MFLTLALLSIAASQKATNAVEEKQIKSEEPKPQLYIATPLNQAQDGKAGSVPLEVKEFFARQQFAPELYGLTYLQPQYQSQRPLTR